MDLFELKWGAEALEERIGTGIGRPLVSILVQRKVERRQRRKHFPVYSRNCFLNWSTTLYNQMTNEPNPGSTALLSSLSILAFIDCSHIQLTLRLFCIGRKLTIFFC